MCRQETTASSAGVSRWPTRTMWSSAADRAYMLGRPPSPAPPSRVAHTSAQLPCAWTSCAVARGAGRCCRRCRLPALYMLPPPPPLLLVLLSPPPLLLLLKLRSRCRSSQGCLAGAWRCAGSKGRACKCSSGVQVYTQGVARKAPPSALTSSERAAGAPKHRCRAAKAAPTRRAAARRKAVMATGSRVLGQAPGPYVCGRHMFAGGIRLCKPSPASAPEDPGQSACATAANSQSRASIDL